mmetsp:Transcript_113882/g.284866  ORF Transcript_113882/g.284866 Transcript_113882/m.284866 type:complete len:217 (-) Transcript_113882:619-1269(-)
MFPMKISSSSPASPSGSSADLPPTAPAASTEAASEAAPGAQRTTFTACGLPLSSTLIEKLTASPTTRPAICFGATNTSAPYMLWSCLQSTKPYPLASSTFLITPRWTSRFDVEEETSALPSAAAAAEGASASDAAAARFIGQPSSTPAPEPAPPWAPKALPRRPPPAEGGGGGAGRRPTAWGCPFLLSLIWKHTESPMRKFISSFACKKTSTPYMA